MGLWDLLIRHVGNVGGGRRGTTLEADQAASSISQDSTVELQKLHLLADGSQALEVTGKQQRRQGGLLFSSKYYFI